VTARSLVIGRVDGVSGEILRTVGKVLVVDDLEATVLGLKGLLELEGHCVSTATNARDALDLVSEDPPDVVLTDVVMPGLTGFDLCRELKSNPATRLIPVVLITAFNDSRDRIEGINAGADDFLSKPVNTAELRARVRSLIRLKRYTDDLDSAESVIISLALTIEARDPYTEGHCERLAHYAMALGEQLRLPSDDLAALFRGGFLHDVGKVGVPDAVLHKTSKLTKSEYEQMKRHTVIGDRLCGQLRSLRSVRPIVRHHHERLNGTGYPDGLKGDAVPLLAQIIGLVDVYDALTTDRPYRRRWSQERAFAALARDVKRGWRARDLVDEFIRLLRDEPVEHHSIEVEKEPAIAP
jgi:putative two-component system response regulator